MRFVNMSSQILTETSSNPTVANFWGDTLVAVSEGLTMITTTTQDGDVICSREIIVTPGDKKKYSFGNYEGRLKNGIPDGPGIMHYTCRIQIAKTARSIYYAEAGDSFAGTWTNGDIENGNLYGRNMKRKAKILAGRRPNPYDLTKDRCED